MGQITIVGLGPGSFGLITAETLEIIGQADVLVLRTAKHPTVAKIQDMGIKFTSYDHIYNEQTSFAKVYQAIAGDVVERARHGESLVYAVPGSPLVAEKTVFLIRSMAAEQSIKVNIIPGMSFLEVLYTRLAIDPIDGLTIIDAADINKLPADVHTGLIITQVYSSQVASDAKLSLMNYFPDEYPVTFLRALGTADEEIRTIPLYELDRLPTIDHLTSVFVPPCTSRARRFTFEPLTGVMARLRSPGGCVWDLEQDHKSLRRYLVEEVYEVLEAIELADGKKLCEELGDLLLQIVFHARVAEESGVFSMQDVIDDVTKKMIRRHPHVFGDITVHDAAEVVVNWEAIKRQEKSGERKAVLDGVPAGLPALMRAYKLQSKAAKVGFDWDTIAPVWGKIEEEVVELKEAAEGGDPTAIESELGDVLFAVVNAARFLHAEPEVALTAANNKFMRRFAYIEAQVQIQGRKWQDYTLAELDKLWNKAKNLEKYEKIK